MGIGTYAPACSVPPAGTSEPASLQGKRLIHTGQRPGSFRKWYLTDPISTPPKATPSDPPFPVTHHPSPIIHHPLYPGPVAHNVFHMGMPVSAVVKPLQHLNLVSSVPITVTVLLLL
jgi:hypothetical protein